MTPVGAVSNRTASAQLETAPTKRRERKCLFTFMIHYSLLSNTAGLRHSIVEDYPARLRLINKCVFDQWHQPAIHTEAVPTDWLLLSNKRMMDARRMSDEISR